jgi:hypothetical protein
MADIEAGWLEEGNYDADQNPVSNDNDYVAPPVRVHIVKTESENVSPQLCIHSTVPIPQAGVAIAGSTQPNVARVLTHNYHRYKAKMQIMPGAGCTGIVTSYKMDSLTNPNPSGATFFCTAATPFYLPDYDSQRPMFMVALGGPATVSVWDEAYPVVVK